MCVCLYVCFSLVNNTKQYNKGGGAEGETVILEIHSPSVCAFVCMFVLVQSTTLNSTLKGEGGGGLRGRQLYLKYIVRLCVCLSVCLF